MRPTAASDEALAEMPPVGIRSRTASWPGIQHAECPASPNRNDTHVPCGELVAQDARIEPRSVSTKHSDVRARWGLARDHHRSWQIAPIAMQCTTTAYRRREKPVGNLHPCIRSSGRATPFIPAFARARGLMQIRHRRFRTPGLMYRGYRSSHPTAQSYKPVDINRRAVGRHGSRRIEACSAGPPPGGRRSRSRNGPGDLSNCPTHGRQGKGISTYRFTRPWQSFPHSCIAPGRAEVS